MDLSFTASCPRLFWTKVDLPAMANTMIVHHHNVVGLVFVVHRVRMDGILHGLQRQRTSLGNHGILQRENGCFVLSKQ